MTGYIVRVGKNSNALQRALREASQESTRRSKWRKKANVDVVGACTDCNTRLHPKDEMWDIKGRTVCRGCRYKYKSAKRLFLVDGFGFDDVMRRMGTDQRTLYG
jgi:hypothetical protein